MRAMRRAMIGAAGMLLAAGPGSQAREAQWQALEAAEAEVRELERELRIVDAAIGVAREAVAAGRRGRDLAGLRREVQEAEAAVEAVVAAAGLDEVRGQLREAQGARDGAVEGLLADTPEWQAARARQADLESRIEALEGRLARLSADEMRELARLRMEKHHLDRHVYGSVRALWHRGEVRDAYQAAHALYQRNQRESGRAEGVGEAQNRLRDARRALDAAIDELPLDRTPGAALLARKAELETAIEAGKAKADEIEGPLMAGARTVTVETTVYDRRNPEGRQASVSLWIPGGHDHIRGIVVAHNMIRGFATNRHTRREAARVGLATMVMPSLPGDGLEGMRRLDAVFEQFAEAAERPELRGAPVFPAGLSASVLATRNLASVHPDRVFGILHVAGGNFQEMPQQGYELTHVPLAAHNGEFDHFGPIGGIQPAYGRQTQWVMIREQMLRFWRAREHQHRMHLVVVPNGGHTAWDTRLAALFLRKAAEYRLPEERRDGSTPAVCRKIPVEQGWLTDASLDHPQHEPAPYAEFTGDRDHAFWHFDEEHARAIYEYHTGRFLLPDPTRATPVPETWPPGRQGR